MKPADAIRAALGQQIDRDRGRIVAWALQHLTPDGNPDEIIARQYDRIVALESENADLRTELIDAYMQIRLDETHRRATRHNVPLAQHLAVIHDLEQARTLLADPTTACRIVDHDDRLTTT